MTRNGHSGHFLRVLKLSSLAIFSSFVVSEEAFAESVGECAVYHGGDLRRATIIESRDHADANDRIDVQFDANFLFQPSIMGPNETEHTSLLFDIDYLDPFNPKNYFESDSTPWNGTFITILVKSAQRVVGLEALTRIQGQVPDGTDYSVTNHREGGLAQIEFDKKIADYAARSRFDVFIAKDDEGHVDQVMSCYSAQDVPNPVCSVDFDEGRLRVSVDTIRRNELVNLPQIIDISRNFVRCLTAERRGWDDEID